jgi:hypothetical protein
MSTLKEIEELAKSLYGESEEGIVKILKANEERQMNKSKYITGYTSRFDLLDFELLWIIKGLEKVENDLGLSEEFDPCEVACKIEFKDLLKRLKIAYNTETLDCAKASRKKLVECLEKTKKQIEYYDKEIEKLEEALNWK